MNKQQVLQEIIKGYRNTISERYQYEKIKAKYDIPESIDEEMVNELRSYFLTNIYPEFNTRTELNEAFSSLDDYIRHPHKLFSVLIDATKLIFSYGRHLPKILKAGLGAMKTFRAATNFENNLVEAAIKNNIEAPYDLAKIDTLIQFLSRKEIEKFIQISQSLFEILHDRGLIKKIKEVIQYLIQVMKKKEETYSLAEIKGLEIGFKMINEGDNLFNRLSDVDQKTFVNLLIKIEEDHLDTIFNS